MVIFGTVEVYYGYGVRLDNTGSSPKATFVPCKRNTRRFARIRHKGLDLPDRIAEEDRSRKAETRWRLGLRERSFVEGRPGYADEAGSPSQANSIGARLPDGAESNRERRDVCRPSGGVGSVRVPHSTRRRAVIRPPDLRDADRGLPRGGGGLGPMSLPLFQGPALGLSAWRFLM